MASAEAPRTRTISFTSAARTLAIVCSRTVLWPRGSSCFALPMRVELPAARMIALTRALPDGSIEVNAVSNMFADLICMP